MATLAKQLGDQNARMELARQAGEFVQLCRVLMQAKGDLFVARQITERVSPRVQDLLNSDQAFHILRRGTAPAGTLSDQFQTITKAASSALALDSGAFANYNLLVSGFVNALSNIGVFDQLRPSMRTVPLGRTLGAVMATALAYVISEGQAKPVSRLSLVNGTLPAQKAHCVVAIANELLKFGGPGTDALLTKELVNASVLAIDGAFLQTLLAGVSVGTSTGSTAASVRNDLASLFSQVPSDQTSKYFIIVTPLIAKMWAAMGTLPNSGAPAFEDMTPQGGIILGTPVIASDALQTGQVVLVDCSGVACGSENIVLSTLSEGVIMPDTAPESPALGTSPIVSLWQSDLSAMLVERWWGATKLRSAAVASLINANSYQSGFSPP